MTVTDMTVTDMFSERRYYGDREFTVNLAIS